MDVCVCVYACVYEYVNVCNIMVMYTDVHVSMKVHMNDNQSGDRLLTGTVFGFRFEK